MANHLLKPLFDLMAEGFQAGESLTRFRNKLKGKEYHLEKTVEGSHSFFANGLTNGSGAEAKTEVWAAPCDLELTECFARRAGASADSASATLVADVGGSDANPLASASIDIDGLTDDTTTDVPLHATVANRQMKKGELLKCSWVTDSTGTITDAVVGIKYKPLAAGELA